MDIFAYTSLSVTGLLIAGFLLWMLWDFIREPIGRLILTWFGIIGLGVCALISGGGWLIMSRAG